MKGVVFTEFLAFVERQMGPAAVDQMIDDCEPLLSTGGAYTAVGTYPCAEMGALLGALSKRSGANPSDLLKSFGDALATAFVGAYPGYFEQASDLFDFVSRIDSYIHAEVRKLYPDAELPEFEVIERDDERIVLVYRSPRALQDLAVGMFMGSAAYFREQVVVNMSLTGAQDEAVFTIRRIAA